MKKTILSLALALAVPFASAHAAPPTGVPCSNASFNPSTYSWGTNITYLDCVGFFGGNDTFYTADDYDEFFSDWLESGESFSFVKKYDPVESNPLVLQSPGFGTNDLFTLLIKQGDYHSIFLFEATGAVSSINWSSSGTISNGGTALDKVSHISSWYVDRNGGNIDECAIPGTCTTVPEPSTYALMGAGLMALGFVSRRRRKAA